MDASSQQAAAQKVSRIKVLSFGDVRTGKSCLIKRYCEKRFVSRYMPTIGVDFGVTKVQYQDRKLKINLFDLSGDPLFAEVRNEFYKDTQAALLVYDVTSKSSFDSLDTWLNELRHYIPDPTERNNIVLLLCANKSDKTADRVVSPKRGQEWARVNGFYYVETSAQSGDGVVDAFQMMFKALFAVIETGKRPNSSRGVLGYTREQMDAMKQLKNAKDNYGCLNLSYGATRDEINKSYKNLAKLLHPDKCVGTESAEAFKKLAGARDELLKTVK